MYDDQEDCYCDEYRYRRRQPEGITLEGVVATTAPFLVRSLLKKHQSLMLAIALADVAIEVHKQYKAKRPMGELVLLHGDYS
ncbi:MAG: hypothetical protein CME71_00265 [Halobacteriovorax sp.]|nr:hypothetical protein [Halobacteriovorax sp.]|tara:strand:- start:337 stop:582 length:246 start_codon:yes stop_codon:yes gene_type:complete